MAARRRFSGMVRAPLSQSQPQPPFPPYPTLMEKVEGIKKAGPPTEETSKALLQAEKKLKTHHMAWETGGSFVTTGFHSKYRAMDRHNLDVPFAARCFFKRVRRYSKESTELDHISQQNASKGKAKEIPPEAEKVEAFVPSEKLVEINNMFREEPTENRMYLKRIADELRENNVFQKKIAEELRENNAFLKKIAEAVDGKEESTGSTVAKMTVEVAEELVDKFVDKVPFFDKVLVNFHTQQSKCSSYPHGAVWSE